MTSQSTEKTLVPVAILAGGKSSRFGADKAQAILAGKPLMQHVYDQMAAQTAGAIVINSATASGDMDGIPVISDQAGPEIGPLAGIHSALSWARLEGHIAIVTVSVDTPFLPGTLLTRLTAQDAPAYAQSGGRKHPTIGLWRVADLERLETALEEGVRAAHAWIDLCGALPVSFELERGVDPFFNINTRDDLEIAEAFLRAS